MPVQIQLRRGTASQWSSANPVIAEGELCIELDTKKFKVGDGVNHWNDIPYTENHNTLANMATDVDITELTNGSVLVYKTDINKWKASTTLDQQNVDAGEY
jgi:hypothetical protein